MSRKRGGRIPQRQAGGFRTRQVAGQSFEQIRAQFRHTFLVEKNYNKALKIIKQAYKIAPKNANVVADTATCYIYLEDWENAIIWAKKAIALDDKVIAVYDTLSHAYGAIKQFDEAGIYGRKALALRDETYGQPEVLLEDLPPLPPVPSAATKDKNIISFSLFGDSPKYCETAVINAELAKTFYPFWTCRFYLDESVPAHVHQRLVAQGVQVVTRTDNAIPATMWRFLALDDSDCHRVIFRDADSLLSTAEASAVFEWTLSDNYFHMMRDWATHTELILAGMWGAIVGALTQKSSMEAQINAYIKANQSKDKHFIDQFFLRDTLWRTVKTNLLQHDRLFGFLGAKNFPVTKRNVGSHIGSNVANNSFTVKVDKPAGTKVIWGLRDTNGKELCRYTSVVNRGEIIVPVPKNLAIEIEKGTLGVFLDK